MPHKNSGSGPAHESRPTIQTTGFAFVLVRVSDETDLDETMVDWAPGTSAGAGSRVTAERPGWRIVDREPMTYEEWLVIEHGEVLPLLGFLERLERIYGLYATRTRKPKVKPNPRRNRTGWQPSR
jgi:hypothetical protein